MNLQDQQLINVTQHIIRIRVNSANKIAEPDPKDIVLEPSGQMASVSVKSVVNRSINGLPVTSQEFGPLVGLPDPQEGVIYVAGALVVQKALREGRTDVVGPNTAPKQDIRYPEGHPQGGKTFAVFGFQEL